MLAYLLDEHLSPQIAKQVARQHPTLRLESLRTFREGRLLEKDDEVLLTAAKEASLTLVAYDQKTIVPLLVRWGVAGIAHAGVVFVDDLTLSSDDIGGLVRALLTHWERHHDEDWTNRVDYLRPAP